MSDKQDEIRPDENTNQTTEGVKKDEFAQNSEDIKEGGKDRYEKPEDQKEDFAREEEGADSKEAHAREEGSASGEKGEEPHEPVIDNDEPSQAQDAPQYACSYEPPHYVPNFTVVDSSKQAEPKENKKRARTGVIVLATVAICLAGAIFMGVFYNVMISKLRKDDPADDPLPVETVDNSLETVTFVKNDGSISVNEEVGSTGYSNLRISEVVELVADTVVEITTSHVETDPFYGNYVTSGAGSGVIISANGVIITNEHVVEGADEIVVRLRNGKEYRAQRVGGDADVDIAVLKINVQNLPFAVMGSSAHLKVGDEVVAIGNPLGQLGGTVTDGIISATDRRIVVEDHLMTLLQTNAAINPGNSGGGLFDRAGQLIGIVNAKQSDTGIEGLGFAIPIDVAYSAAKDIIEYGYVRGKLDLGFTVDVSDSGFVRGRVQYPAGIYIVETSNSSLKVYDRIVSMNGVTINSIQKYYEVIDSLSIGDALEMKVSRASSGGFSEVNVTVTVKEQVPNR